MNRCTCNTVPIRYNGSDIDCLGVAKGDSFEAVIRKVSEFVCNISFEDGVDGTDGADGQGVDHVSFQSSSIGDEPALPGATDTYVVWGDAGETINLGTFEVYNGTNAPVEGDTVFHKVLDTGSWDMDSTASITVPHGLDPSKIVDLQVLIYGAGNTYPLYYLQAGDWSITGADITLSRVSSGFFDDAGFSSTLSSRGKILIHYIP
jgi:hypothetical protein